MRAKRDVLAFPSPRSIQRRGCRSCGEAIMPHTAFCSSCGSAQAGATASLVLRSRPSVFRRAMAEIIDRIVPFPFLAYFFPVWLVVVVVYHLICDGSPTGQSVGKWACRLCVVSTATGEPCGIWRSALRRSTIALGQAAYCVWVMIPFIVAYELVSVALVWLNPTGRRIEDYIAGTQVITRGAYRKLRRSCAACGEHISARARYCSQCGQAAGD